MVAEMVVVAVITRLGCVRMQRGLQPPPQREPKQRHSTAASGATGAKPKWPSVVRGTVRKSLPKEAASGASYDASKRHTRGSQRRPTSSDSYESDPGSTESEVLEARRWVAWKRRWTPILWNLRRASSSHQFARRPIPPPPPPPPQRHRRRVRSPRRRVRSPRRRPRTEAASGANPWKRRRAEPHAGESYSSPENDVDFGGAAPEKETVKEELSDHTGRVSVKEEETVKEELSDHTGRVPDEGRLSTCSYASD